MVLQIYFQKSTDKSKEEFHYQLISSEDFYHRILEFNKTLIIDLLHTFMGILDMTIRLSLRKLTLYLPKIKKFVVTHGVHLMISFVLYFHKILPSFEDNAYI